MKIGELQKAEEVFNKLLEGEMKLAHGDHSALGWEAQECWIDAHFRLVKACKESGDLERANSIQAQLLEIWKEADDDLTKNFN